MTKTKKSIALLSSAVMALSALSYLPSGMLNLHALAAESYDANGFAEDGTYQPAEDTDEDGYFEIGNAGQLYWFAGLVNGTLNDGTEQNVSANAILTANITVNENVLDSNGNLTEGDYRKWVPMGSGNGTESDEVNYRGNFDGNGYTISGLYFNDTKANDIGLFNTIENAKISNLGIVDSYFKGSTEVGSICGYSHYGSVINCYSSSTVIGSYRIGGMVGRGYHGQYENCYNTGIVNGSDAVGGISGCTCGTIKNSYNIGKIETTSSSVHSILGEKYQGVGSVQNCYYLDTTASDNLATSKNTAQFESGEVAYLLQSGQNSPVWGQSIGTDSAPVLGGAQVYRSIVYTGCNNATPIDHYAYSNTQEDNRFSEHSYNETGFCTVCNAYEPAVKNESNFYEITNAGQLYWFAGLVNGTLEDGTTKDVTANAVLTCDITVNHNVSSANDDSYLKWTPIGSEPVSGDTSSHYNGEFNGNGHTISGLYFSDATVNDVGLFGVIGEHAKISNLGILDSYFSGGKEVGGICGYSYYGTITNCYNSSTIEGASMLGGICGRSYYGPISSCYNEGIVRGTGENVGGIAGSGYGNFSKCYNVGTLSGASNFGGIIGFFKSSNKSSVKDCYYLENCNADGTNFTNSNGTAMSAEKFADGTVCDAVEYHTYRNDKCKVCNAYENGIGMNLAGYTLSLSGNIGVNFYMELDKDVLSDESAYMLFTLPNGKTSTVMVQDATADKVSDNDIQYYVFPCNVAAKEMTDTIQAQLFTADKSSAVYTYTVKDYADYILSHTSDYDEETRALASAMLTYGDYAKAYFDGTDLAATAEIEEVTSDTLSDYTALAGSTLPDGIEYCGSSLLLDSNTTLRHYFKAMEDTDTSAYGFAEKDGLYYLEYANISALNLSSTIRTSVGKYLLVYSPLSYAYAVLESENMDTGLKNLVKALYLYNQAASAYAQNRIL